MKIDELLLEAVGKSVIVYKPKPDKDEEDEGYLVDSDKKYHVGIRVKDPKSKLGQQVLVKVLDNMRWYIPYGAWLKNKYYNGPGDLLLVFDGARTKGIETGIRHAITKYEEEISKKLKTSAEAAKKRAETVKKKKEAEAARGPLSPEDAELEAMDKAYTKRLNAAKRRVTIRKSGGDDLYSWALFVDGYRRASGMNRRSAEYERDQEIKRIMKGDD